MVSQTFRLPRTLQSWFWPRALNAQYIAASQESMDWVEKYIDFTPTTRKAFDRCKFGLLVGLCHPEADIYNLRSCCDFIHIVFLLDDYTDTADASTVSEICAGIMDATVHVDVPRPDGEHALVEMTRQFWERASKGMPDFVKKRFVDAFGAYIESIPVQAEQRQAAKLLPFSEFVAVRRENAGIRPLFPLIEACMTTEWIPQEVMDHPALVSLMNDACDLVAIDNDIASYRKEYLAGDASYNLVAAVMAEKGMDLDEALEWVATFHAGIEDNFLKVREDVLQHANGVPSWGKSIDTQVEKYITGLAQWVRGNAEWSFDSGRYFGDRGLDVKKSRVVTLE